MNDDSLILIDPRPTRADAVKNHDLLLQTAARLFEEAGVDAVSMSAVAQAAGVGKGTLYRHFPSKEALCYALLDADQRDLQNRALAQMRTNTCARENLRWFLGEVAAFVLRNETMLNPTADTVIEHQAHFWWRQTIRGLLSQALHSHDLTANDVRGNFSLDTAHADGDQVLDVEYATDVLYLMLSTRTLRFQRYSMNYPAERIIAGLLDMVERFLK
ncbi:MAG: helix-turn-helix domain-containing protein [Chloroflexota bacterium]|nr:helix-turn-helix domain-containing protein [Chloroflexota bacterium]